VSTAVCELKLWFVPESHVYGHAQGHATVKVVDQLGQRTKKQSDEHARESLVFIRFLHSLQQ
jgi:hypothetical protein